MKFVKHADHQYGIEVLDVHEIRSDNVDMLKPSVYLHGTSYAILSYLRGETLFHIVRLRKFCQVFSSLKTTMRISDK